MELSQEVTRETSNLCNELLAMIGSMEKAAVELSLLDCGSASLLIASALMSWCQDARDNVVEIKSLL